MEKKTASTRTEGLLALFDLHTDLLGKALVNLSQDDMHNRMGTQANHMAWITGSLVNQRFMMASESNHGLKQTGEELFKDHKGIDDNASYPTVEQYLKDWEKITPIAREALRTIDDARLDSELDMGGMKMSWYDMITFTMYREASMIGQLALWRRFLGHPALKYD